MVKHRQLARQVGVLGALRSRAWWTSKKKLAAALVDNSLQLRRPQDQLIATLVSLVDNLRRLSSASSTTRHTDGQLAMLTKLHQRRSWRQVGKKNPITSATVSHARRTSTTTDAFNHHHHGYVKKYTSAQATPSGSSSTSRTTTPPPSKASTRIVASTRNRPADVRQL